ncbi:MAG: glycosyltransferase [Candidatus Peribacteria bacterium]|nr:MAG: glycosyltransferase [Candidatus Peribacteria bacterium]
MDTERFAKDIQTPPSPYLRGKGLGGGGKYYIILSALTEFKRIDIAISAFNTLQIPLLIIGEGNKRSELESISHKNIHFAGAQYGDELVSLVQESLGLIFPGEEDFGIVPIEVMAAGKPVFALGKGGLRETVIPGKTGDFFFEADGSDFIEHFTSFHEKNKSG